jgi:hypothetical protein
MAQYLIDFISYFGLDTLGSSNLTVSMTLGIIITSYIGLMLTMCGIRCVFELIKIITDRSNF